MGSFAVALVVWATFIHGGRGRPQGNLHVGDLLSTQNIGVHVNDATNLRNFADDSLNEVGGILSPQEINNIGFVDNVNFPFPADVSVQPPNFGQKPILSVDAHELGDGSLISSVNSPVDDVQFILGSSSPPFTDLSGALSSGGVSLLGLEGNLNAGFRQGGQGPSFDDSGFVQVPTLDSQPSFNDPDFGQGPSVNVQPSLDDLSFGQGPFPSNGQPSFNDQGFGQGPTPSDGQQSFSDPNFVQGHPIDSQPSFDNNPGFGQGHPPLNVQPSFDNPGFGQGPPPVNVQPSFDNPGFGQGAPPLNVQPSFDNPGFGQGPPTVNVQPSFDNPDFGQGPPPLNVQPSFDNPGFGQGAPSLNDQQSFNDPGIGQGPPINSQPSFNDPGFGQGPPIERQPSFDNPSFGQGAPPLNDQQSFNDPGFGQGPSINGQPSFNDPGFGQGPPLGDQPSFNNPGFGQGPPPLNDQQPFNDPSFGQGPPIDSQSSLDNQGFGQGPPINDQTFFSDPSASPSSSLNIDSGPTSITNVRTSGTPADVLQGGSGGNNVNSDTNDSPLRKIFNLLTLGIFNRERPDTSSPGALDRILSTLTLGLLGNREQGSPRSRDGFLNIRKVTQIASDGLDKAAKEATLGLNLARHEVRYVGEEQVKQAVNNIVQTQQTIASIIQSSYLTFLQKQDAVSDLMMGLVDNLGNFARSTVNNAFERVSGMANTFGTVVNNAKVGLLNSMIAKGEAAREFVNGTLNTVGDAFREVTTLARLSTDSNIRSITGIKNIRII